MYAKYSCLFNHINKWNNLKLTIESTMFCFSNWGSENDPNISYHNGNSDPRGFGKKKTMPNTVHTNSDHLITQY